MSERKEHIFIDGVEYKHCSKCGEWKPLNKFSTCTSNWDKLQRACKSCRSIYGHSEQRKQYKKQYYADNIEYFKQRNDKYRAEHPEYMKQYKATHQEEIKQYYIKHKTTIEGHAYEIRKQNLQSDRKYGRIGKDEDPLPPLEYYIWALQQPDFYDGKQYPFDEMGLDRIYNDKPHTFANVVPCSTANNLRKQKMSFDKFKELIKKENEELELAL